MQITPSEIAQKIEPALAQDSEIVAAYLFGSAAMNRLRPGSDVDIAILLKRGDKPLNRKNLLELLLPKLCRALRMDVHLLFLNDASYLACSQVFKTGELLYARDRRELARFHMVSAALFADFAPYMRMTQIGLQNKLRLGHG